MALNPIQPLSKHSASTTNVIEFKFGLRQVLTNLSLSPKSHKTINPISLERLSQFLTATVTSEQKFKPPSNLILYHKSDYIFSNLISFVKV